MIATEAKTVARLLARVHETLEDGTAAARARADQSDQDRTGPNWTSSPSDRAAHGYARGLLDGWTAATTAAKIAAAQASAELICEDHDHDGAATV